MPDANTLRRCRVGRHSLSDDPPIAQRCLTERTLIGHFHSPVVLASGGGKASRMGIPKRDAAAFGELRRFQCEEQSDRRSLSCRSDEALRHVLATTPTLGSRLPAPADDRQCAGTAQ